MSKEKKGVSKIALILIVAVLIIVGIILVFFLGNNKNNNTLENNDLANSNSKWKIMIQGEAYKLPFNLKKLTEKGFIYVNMYGEDWENVELDSVVTFGLNEDLVTNYGIPSAGIESYGTFLELNLVQKENKPKEYENITVEGFRVCNVSTDFFSINGIGCGSSVNEVINALEIDLESENVSKSDDLNSYFGYLTYKDEENNIIFELDMEHGQVWQIKISTTNKDN